MILSLEHLKEFAAVRLQTRPELLAVNARRVVLSQGETLSKKVASCMWCVRLGGDGATDTYIVDNKIFPIPYENPVSAGSDGGGIDLSNVTLTLRDVNGIDYDATFNTSE